jgi:hypothetical protein
MCAHRFSLFVRDARWTVKFTKAKPREDGSTPPVDLAITLHEDPHCPNLEQIAKTSFTKGDNALSIHR